MKNLLNYRDLEDLVASRPRITPKQVRDCHKLLVEGLSLIPFEYRTRAFTLAMKEIQEKQAHGKSVSGFRS